jgi:hypothetical protein
MNNPQTRVIITKTPLHGAYELIEVDGEFCISEHQCSIPGAFATREGAIHATDLSDETIQRLQDAANARAGGTGGTITNADLGI